MGSQTSKLKVPLDQFVKEMIGCDCLQRQGTDPRDSGHLSLSSISSVLKTEEPIRSSGLNVCRIQAIDLTQLPFAEPSNLSDLGIVLPSPEKEISYIYIYIIFDHYLKKSEGTQRHKWYMQYGCRWENSFLVEFLACRLQAGRVCPKELVLFLLSKRGAAISLPLINLEWGGWVRQILHIAISLPLLSCHFRGAN